MARMRLRTLVVVAVWLGAAVAHGTVPELPFGTNPDPDLCGIPVPMGDGFEGVLHATFDGVVQEELVHLVDSHLRAEVTGHVPAGSRVEVALFQENPELDFYFVRWHGPDGIESGWVPAPYLDVAAEPR
ncbi:MAG: hypothetical protein P1P87_17085 [Trueperaceae bacterium]|nr:hypothetical protein [Trueperaceae bacterium]